METTHQTILELAAERGIVRPSDLYPLGLPSIAHKHPNAIVCLLSALRVHDLTTQAPFEIWLAIQNKSRTPKTEYPPHRGRLF